MIRSIRPALTPVGKAVPQAMISRIGQFAARQDAPLGMLKIEDVWTRLLARDHAGIVLFTGETGQRPHSQSRRAAACLWSSDSPAASDGAAGQREDDRPHGSLPC